MNRFGENFAIEVVGDRYRVIAAAPNAKAYKLFKRNGRAVIVQLRQDTKYMLLADLLRRK